MIAMQYSFVMPADYDMAIIRQRIADKGPMLDDFDGLHFKAYLHATRGVTAPDARENLYAPFYLWRDSAAMQRFLGSTGFANLTQAFGWPTIRYWPVWHAYVSPEARQATHATREIHPIESYSPLDTLCRDQHAVLQHDVERGALAAVNAFEPTSWTQVSFRLWDAAPISSQRQLYEVGHVSQPTAQA